MTPNTGVIVGLSIAAVVVLILIVAGCSYALAQRRRTRKKPHRTASISGFIYDEHGRKRKVRGSRSEDWGLLEEAPLAPYSENQQRTSFNDRQSSLGPIVRPAEPHINLLDPKHSPTPPFFVPPRTPSPLLKTLPPLTIPSGIPRNIAPLPRVPSPVEVDGSTETIDTESASIYSQVSASTNMHYLLTRPEPVPPVPALPPSIPELPPHLRYYDPIDRSDSRATLQRGDTRAVSNMLKARANRVGEDGAFMSRSMTRISEIERIGSIRDVSGERRHELTSAFQRDLGSVKSQSSVRTVSDYEVPRLMTVQGSSQEAVEVRPLRIPSEKARKIVAPQ